MTSYRFSQVMRLLWALLFVDTCASYGQTFDIVTLVSPRQQEGGGRFGLSVSGAGDVNRDGSPDLIVGAPLDGERRNGRAYVFSGRDLSLLLELVSPKNEPEGGFGYAVAGAGDVNEDGFADLIVGAASTGPQSPIGAKGPDAFFGRAYVFSGKDGSLLLAFEPPNIQQGFGLVGSSVAGAGDVNQDGAPDVVVGTGFASPVVDPEKCGRAYVFSGRNGSLIFELIPPNKDDDGRFGDAVGGVGDVNQDGSADVIVGAWGEDPDTSPDFAGRAYVFSGKDGSLLFELRSPNEEAFGAFGRSVAAAGDLNQDGIPDALVGAYKENPGTSPLDAGRAYAFSGRDGSLLFELVSPNEEVHGNFGWSVAGAGDVDRDGHDDAIVGAFKEEPDDSPRASGRVYIFSGRDGGLLVELRSPHEETRGNFGNAVSGAGDTNHDGLADVIVGAYLEDPGTNGINSGRAYAFVSSSGQPRAFGINSRSSVSSVRVARRDRADPSQLAHVPGEVE